MKKYLDLAYDTLFLNSRLSRYDPFMTSETESARHGITPTSRQAWSGLMRASDRSSSLAASALGFSLLLLATDFEPEKVSLITAWSLFATTIVLALTRSVFEGFGEPIEGKIDVGPGYSQDYKHQDLRVAQFVVALAGISIATFIAGFFVFLSFLLRAL